MKKNKNGLGLVFAIIMTVVIYLIAIFLLEYLIPFGRNTKGIENSSSSYYQANGGIEEGLWFVSQNDVGTSSGKTLSSDALDYSYDIKAQGTNLPPAGEGDSDIDKDWNKIGLGDSISMEVGNNLVNWSSVTFDFRVPNFNMDSGVDLDLENTGTGKDIITWQLSSINDTLNASGSLISTNLFGNGITWNGLDSLSGYKLDYTTDILGDFYSNNCGTGSGCVFKLLVINDLIVDSGGNTKIPYLEWQADFGSTIIPTQLIRIKSVGKSYGFTKDISIKVPQRSILDAFDFTVFQ